mgnify:CR=1 FL=1
MQLHHLVGNEVSENLENLINKDIKPRFWGIRNTGDKTFDQTMIALMNLENEDLNFLKDSGAIIKKAKLFFKKILLTKSNSICPKHAHLSIYCPLCTI